MKSLKRVVIAVSVASVVVVSGPSSVAAEPSAPSPAARGAAPASQVEAKKLSDAFVAVAEKTSPSVVQIEITARDEDADPLRKMFGKGGQESPVARGTGSGVVFTSDGAILTNNHVIDGALSINVRFRDGRFLSAKLLGRDPATDLAVVKVEATNLPAAKFADSDQARVGEWVVAIGSPFGLGYTVTSGVVSAKGRGGLGMNAIEDYLQTDASINPGNSGGPLCDLEGRVLGINTMIVGRGSGIGFAVPSNMARKVAEQISKSGKVTRPWLGLGVQDLTPELAKAMKLEPGAGVLVNSIAPGGPAQKANLKAGDVVSTLSGKPLKESRDFVREVLAHDVGTILKMEILRDGKRYQTQVTPDPRPEPAPELLPVQQKGAPQQGLGFSVRDLLPEQAQRAGLPARPLPVITQVAPGSSADRAGLRVGDVIVEVDGKPDPNSADVGEAGKDGQVLLRARRGSLAFYAAVSK